MKRSLLLLIALLQSTLLFAQNLIETEYMNAFVVVADSAQSYYELREKMFVLSDELKLEIDTIGRGYDANKNLICLPENDADEMWAGDYPPRRYPDETLSLEYVAFYDEESPTKTIGLITGIFDSKDKAEAQLNSVIEHSSNAYIINTDIYMGCTH